MTSSELVFEIVLQYRQQTTIQTREEYTDLYNEGKLNKGRKDGGNKRKQHFNVSKKFATNQSRVLTYQNWPHANIALQKLAYLGFYYVQSENEIDNVVYFACGVGLDPPMLFV